MSFIGVGLWPGWWRHAPRSPQLTLSYKNTLQVTQHGLSLNAEDEQAWPNLYGQQSHSLKYILQKMHARAPDQPAASKPFRATLKTTLESQPQRPWEPKGNCSWIQLPLRDHSPAASIAQQCWISLGSHYTLLSLRITVTGGSFEGLCPDSASDISRGVFPTAAAAKEHNAWNGGLGGKRKHDSANFLLAEQFLHELMCCKGLLCHLPSAGSLRSQPGYLASGPTTDRSRKMGCFKLQYVNTTLSWTFVCLWCGPITPQVQYQFSKWLNKHHVQL